MNTLINILNYLWAVVLGIANIIVTMLAIFVIGGCCIYANRAKKIVLVDFDCLTDIEAIKERCRIWLSNHRVGTADDYFAAHISEQTLIPQNILRCIKWQNMGYKLMFVSERKENLRIESAKLLNEWELNGELHLMGDSYEKACKFISLGKQLREERKLEGLLAAYTEDNRHLAQVILQTKRL